MLAPPRRPASRQPAATALATRGLALLLGCGLATAQLGCGGAGKAAAARSTDAPPSTGAAHGERATTPQPAAPSLELPTQARPLEYDVALRLDPSKETFRGSMRIALEIVEPIDHLWLNGKDLVIEKATLTLADASVIAAPTIAAPSEHFVGFAFGLQVPASRVSLTIEYAGKISPDEVDGVFKQQSEDASYVYTQFEAISARKAFPCFDEPAHKVPWTIHLTTPDGTTAYSNAPLADKRRGDDGFTTYDFEKTPPMSSYLVAFAVGPFEEVALPPLGRNRIPGRILTLAGRSADAAYAAAHLGEIVSRLEDYFDMALPYPKLDHIAVPQFFGAMENPGLITYASRILLQRADELTPEREQAFWVVAAHEIAHHWFGDYVTLNWWDDLWLNESFATWLSEKIVRAARPAWKRDIEVVRDAQSAMAGDAQASSRPVRVPIDSMETIDDLFSLVAYEKGNAMLTMFERWIGDEAFRAGVRAYIRAHAWGTATAADFLAKIGEASDPSMPASFRSFLDQPGVPLLRVALRCSKAKGARPSLSLEQERFRPAGSGELPDLLWHIPVCVRYGNGASSARACQLMTEPALEVPLPGKKCPEWVIANAGATGYYRVAYEGGLLAKFISDPARASSEERVSALGDLEAAVQTGEVSLGEVLALAGRLGSDKNDHVVRAAIGLVGDLEEHLVPPALLPNYRRFLIKTFGARAKALGMTPRTGEPESARQLRERLLSVLGEVAGEKGIVGEAVRLANAWIDTAQGIDPSMVDLVLGIAAANGDAAFHQRLLETATATKDKETRRRLTGALASVRDPALVKKNLAVLLEGPFEYRETFGLLSAAMSQASSREDSYAFVKTNFEAVAGKLPLMMRGFLAYIGGSFCDAEHEADFKAFMEPRLPSLPNSKVAFARSLDSLRMCAALRASQGPALEAFLEKQ